MTADAVMDFVFALPEVKAYGAFVARASKGASHMTGHIEGLPQPGCAPRTPECRYDVYVGEDQGDHTVRWFGFAVDPETKVVWVRDETSDSYLTYDSWRRRVRERGDIPEMKKLPEVPMLPP